MKKEAAIPPATEVKPEVAAPKPPQSFEIARSEPMNIRAMRQLASALYVTTQNIAMNRCEPEKRLATATDTASEYNGLLKVVDDFYVQAKRGIGDVKIRLVAESTGFTKEMMVFIKEKDGWTDGPTLAT